MKRAILILAMLALLLTPAYAESNVPDITFEDDGFYNLLFNMSMRTADYADKTVSITGYVTYLDNNPGAPFMITRLYNCCGDDPSPVGMDCQFDGELPPENSWVEAIGKVTTYKRDNGYTYLLIVPEHLTAVEEGQIEVRN